MADWIELKVLAMGQGACNLVKEYKDDKLIYLALNDFGSDDFPDERVLASQRDIIFNAMQERAAVAGQAGKELYLDDLVITHKDSDHLSYMKNQIFSYCTPAVVKTTANGRKRQAFLLPKTKTLLEENEEDEVDYQHILYCELDNDEVLYALEYQHAEELDNVLVHMLRGIQGVAINSHTTTFYYEGLYRYQHDTKGQSLKRYCTAEALTRYIVTIGGKQIWCDTEFAANISWGYKVDKRQIERNSQNYQIVDMITIPFVGVQYSININWNVNVSSVLPREGVFITYTTVATIKKNGENLVPVLSKSENGYMDDWLGMKTVVEIGKKKVADWTQGWTSPTEELVVLGQWLGLEMQLLEDKCMNADSLEDIAVERELIKLFDPATIYAYFSAPGKQLRKISAPVNTPNKLYIKRSMMGGVPGIYTLIAKGAHEMIYLFSDTYLQIGNAGVINATCGVVSHKLYTFFLLRKSNENASSLVTLYTYEGNDNILLPGDATRATMGEMAKRYEKKELPSKDSIVVAPHHGSFESVRNGSKASPTAKTLEAFLQAVQPKTMIVNASHKSIHGHPHKTFIVQANKNMTVVDRSPHIVLFKGDDNKLSLYSPYFRLGTTQKRLYTCAMPEVDRAGNLSVPYYNYTMAHDNITVDEIVRLAGTAVSVTGTITPLDSVALQEPKEQIRPVHQFEFILP